VSQVRILPGPPDVSAAQKALSRCRDARQITVVPHWPRICHEPSRAADRNGEWRLNRGASDTSIPLVARGGIAITDEIEFERLIRRRPVV
jgi:hypothetical protein